MKDFYFGTINKTAGSEFSLSLNHLNKLIRLGISPSAFTAQLNRLLAQTDSHLVVSDGTSYPDFITLINHINPDAISMIELEARTDINTAVDATLACNIYLADGVLNVRTNWCGYKDIRADEIMATLITPLYLLQLNTRTVIDNTLLSSDPADAIHQVFVLSKYPSQSNKENYIKDIDLAINVTASGFQGEAAYAEFDKRRAENTLKDWK